MARCDRCGSNDLFRVQLAPRGTPVLHSTCRHCEHRWWEERDGAAPREIALSDALVQLAAR